MHSKLDRELGERMFELTRRVPFTNAVSARQALGVFIPGVPMGSCAVQCNLLMEDLKDIPGSARLHRAIAPSGNGPRNGKPGAHVLLVKETNEGWRVLDPNFLHKLPFNPEDQEDWIPSHLAGVRGFADVKFECHSDHLEVGCPFVMPGLGSNATYSFDIHPDHAVTATGQENAGRVFPDYLLRFVLDDTVVQVVYDYGGSGEIYWVQGGAEYRGQVQLDGVAQAQKRGAYDRILQKFELDLPSVSDLLRSAPQWVEEFKRRQTEKH